MTELDGTIKILLVDDQRIIGEAIKRMLESEPDFKMLQCLEPGEAIKTAHEFAPTVILQDLVMPGIDGLDLLKAYKADPALKDIPVIVMSSEEDSDIKLKAFTLRASDYMVKVPARAELLSRVRELAKCGLCLRRLSEAESEKSRTQSVLEAASWLTAAYGAATLIADDLETPIQYVSGNLPFIRDAFSSLVRFRVRLNSIDIPEDVKKAMQEAAEKEDLDFVFDDAPKALRQSQDEMARISSMVKAIKSIPFQQGEGTLETVDVNKLLLETSNFLKSRIGAVADFKSELDETQPKINAHPGELRMAFVLLFTGAVRAIEARFGKNAQKGQLFASTKRSGLFVEIAVSDDGAAVQNEALAYLCQPLHGVAKEGLMPRRSLRPVKLIAEACGGVFDIKPLPEFGCSMKLRLPVVE